MHEHRWAKKLGLPAQRRLTVHNIALLLCTVFSTVAVVHSIGPTKPDRQKATPKSPSCISTGGLYKYNGNRNGMILRQIDLGKRRNQKRSIFLCITSLIRFSWCLPFKSTASLLHKVALCIQLAKND